MLIDINNVRKGIVDVGEEATKFFAKTQSWKPESLTNLSKINNIKFDKFIEQQGLADESLVAFLRDTNYAQKDLANYQLYLKNTGKATSTTSSFAPVAFALFTLTAAKLLILPLIYPLLGVILYLYLFVLCS